MAMEHLPPDELSALAHGDLLGQNILLAPGQPPHVIDWEFARVGDPAYDLAIVTRGVRRPFQIDGGLERLLRGYRSSGGGEVTADHVHPHELGLIGGWYREAMSGAGGHSLAEESLRMRSLLRQLR